MYRGILKGKADFGATIYGSKSIIQVAESPNYKLLCEEIGQFFRTGVAPVSEAETIEMFTFMEAADESIRQGGKAVPLAGVLEKARTEAATMLP